MFNFDCIIKEYIKEHNVNWLKIPDHPYRIFIIGGSGSGKTNALLTLINHDQILIRFIYMPKISSEGADIRHFNDSEAFIEYLNDMDNIHKNIKEYNTNKKIKILIVFDDMIANMISNKKVNPIVTDLFIRGRKLNISLVFVKQFYFAIPENIRLNITHYFIMKIPNN